MTKKDYELLAKAISDSRHAAAMFPSHWSETFIIILSQKLKEDNPNFDPERFKEACLKS